MFVPYYRALSRRVARLPLDHRSLEIARQKLKLHFTGSKKVPTYSVANRKLYDRAISVFDGLLVDEKYKDYPQLLDLIYRDLEPRPAWVEEFHHTRYGAFKDTWPQVHLISEFGDAKACKTYYDALAKMQPTTEFLFARVMSIPRDIDLGTLTPLKRTLDDNHGPAQEKILVEKMKNFHKFLKKNANMLLETQIHILDVCYRPNRYGLPSSIATMEAELKAKVNYAKHLLDAFRPIQEQDLTHLIGVVTAQGVSEPKINPRFYRYMLRKRAKEANMVSPDVRKYVRHKLLIPNERNILHIYRQYVVRQFFVGENGDYKMSPMCNIYD